MTKEFHMKFLPTTKALRTITGKSVKQNIRVGEIFVKFLFVDDGEEKPKNGSDNLNRVKRKSGKTTSALNRPKGSADIKKKSSRKQHAHIDDGGHYMIDSEENLHSKETETDSEEIDESPEQALFREISEVRFPAEIGPLGGNRLCKIKCIDGYWTGPLCSAGDQGRVVMLYIMV